MNALRIIKFFQKTAYFVGMGCFGGLFVINAQPKNAEVDRMFQIALGIGIAVCLGVIFGLMAIEKRLSKRT